VTRLYDLAVKDDRQLVYYDPGVGTMGARGATTRAGRWLTRAGGLVLGHGVRENVEEAYSFLMRAYQPGDRIFIFGFSRGAYTARALTGMLRTVGLLRPGAENLVPYAMKLYAKGAGAARPRPPSGSSGGCARSSPTSSATPSSPAASSPRSSSWGSGTPSSRSAG
jgi:uncharacterized protein (DUF2235 family)